MQQHDKHHHRPEAMSWCHRSHYSHPRWLKQSSMSASLIFISIWDRPGALCFSTTTLAPGHTSPWATKYKETIWDLKKKETVYMCSWANSGPKDTKRQKTQLPFLKSQEQKMGIGSKRRDCTCPLHPTPPKGWANHLRDPFSQATGYTPTLTPYKGQGCPPTLGEQAR